MTDNPALSVGQPIGYIAPRDGRRLSLGLADPMDGEPSFLGAPLADPRLCNGLTTPTTRTAAEGIVTAGRGQAIGPAWGFAAMLGLCAT
jgi:hypothetical protein